MATVKDDLTLRVGMDFSPSDRATRSQMKKVQRDFDTLGRSGKKSMRPLGEGLSAATANASEFDKSMAAANARVLAFGASAGLIIKLSQAFSALVKTTVSVEKSLKDINVILNASDKNLQKFKTGLFSIAKETGQAFETVAVAATELSRQGLGAAETLKRTRDALILTRLSGLDAASAVEALTATLNTFNSAGLDSTIIINKLANVDAAFAVSSGDLAEALKRVGASAQGANVQFDELLAVVTAAQQKTARGGAVIGNSFKTIFTRIQRPAVLKQLEQLGIAVRDVEGGSLPAMQILTSLAQTYDSLTQSQKAQISESVAGVFQINILKAALSDLGGEYSTYNRALVTAGNSTNQAIERNKQLNTTVAALLNETMQTFGEFAASTGDVVIAPAIKGLLGQINSAMSMATSEGGESAGAKIGKGILDGIGKFLGGPGVAVAAIVVYKLLKGLAVFAAEAGAGIIALGQSAASQKNLQAGILNLLKEQPGVIDKIRRGTMSVDGAASQILNKLRLENKELRDMEKLAGRIAVKLGAAGVRSTGGKTTLPKKLTAPGYALATTPIPFGKSVPNFSAIGAAISREKAAGIPASAIRVSSSNSLKSFSNPSGLAVHNTIDEPRGLSQGINRYKSLGLNPNSAGIPNFASFPAPPDPRLSRAQIGSGFAGRAAKSSLFGESGVTVQKKLVEALKQQGKLTRKQIEVIIKDTAARRKGGSFPAEDQGRGGRRPRAVRVSYPDKDQSRVVGGALPGKKEKKAFSTGRLLGVAFGAQMLSSQLEQAAPDSQAIQLLGGGVTGAATGGLVGGPIGAIVGAGIGIAEALDRTKEKIAATESLFATRQGGLQLLQQGLDFRDQGKDLEAVNLISKGFLELDPVTRGLIGNLKDLDGQTVVNVQGMITNAKILSQAAISMGNQGFGTGSLGLLKRGGSMVADKMSALENFMPSTGLMKAFGQETLFDYLRNAPDIDFMESIQSNIGTLSGLQGDGGKDKGISLPQFASEALDRGQKSFKVEDLKDFLGASQLGLFKNIQKMQRSSDEGGQGSYFRAELDSFMKDAGLLFKKLGGKGRAEADKTTGPFLSMGQNFQSSITSERELTRRGYFAANTFSRPYDKGGATGFSSQMNSDMDMQVPRYMRTAAIGKASEVKKQMDALISGNVTFGGKVGREFTDNKGEKKTKLQPRNLEMQKALKDRDFDSFLELIKGVEGKTPKAIEQIRALTQSVFELREVSTIGGIFGAEFTFDAIDRFDFIMDSSERLAKGMKGSFAGAFDSFVEGSNSAGEAFRNFALDVSRQISRMATQYLTSQLFDAAKGTFGNIFGGLSKGGPSPTGLARGGMVNGGSGVRDDIPAMLTGGEFVMRKSAVDSLGLGFMENINQYASGGLVLPNEFNLGTKGSRGKFNVSSRLSSFALTNPNNPQNAIRQDRNQQDQDRIKSFNDYEENKRLALSAYRNQKRQRAIGSLIQAGAILALDFAGNKFGGKKPDGGSGGAGLDYTGPRGNNPAPATGGRGKPFSQFGRKGDLGTGFNLANPSRKTRASGGPAAGMAPIRPMGGSSYQGNGSESGMLASSIDRLSLSIDSQIANQSTSSNGSGGLGAQTNNVTIQINVQKDGKATATEGGSGGSDQPETSQDTDRQKKLAGMIKSVVLKEVTTQLRPGGLLSKAR